MLPFWRDKRWWRWWGWRWWYTVPRQIKRRKKRTIDYCKSQQVSLNPRPQPRQMFIEFQNPFTWDSAVNLYLGRHRTLWNIRHSIDSSTVPSPIVRFWGHSVVLFYLCLVLDCLRSKTFSPPVIPRSSDQLSVYNYWTAAEQVWQSVRIVCPFLHRQSIVCVNTTSYSPSIQRQCVCLVQCSRYRYCELFVECFLLHMHLTPSLGWSHSNFNSNFAS